MFSALKKLLVLILILVVLNLTSFPFTSTPILADWTFDAEPPTCTLSIDSSTPSPYYINNTIKLNIISTYTDIAQRQLRGTIGSSNETMTQPSNPISWTFSTTGTYNFRGTAIDLAGNQSTCTTEAGASDLSVDVTSPSFFSPSFPWLRITGGDVHSNQ